MGRKAWHLLFYLAALGLIIVPLARERARRLANPWRILRSPYPSAPWSNLIPAKVNLHTHTTQSDGRLLPHVVIDRYHFLGYDGLALTDHDEVTWPWTNLSALPLTGYSRRLVREQKGEASMVWLHDRDPAALNMIAIQGCEWSDHHHMGAFFTPHPGSSTEHESLRSAREENTPFLAMFYHPGRYSHPPSWYVSFFQQYPELVGVEVYNQGDRYPNDRKTWDAILSLTMPDRPVWGYSNDDMHTEDQLGRNWNIFLLSNKTGSAVREAMAHGWSYFVFAPNGHTGTPPPSISEITTHDLTGTISITAEGWDEIVWISEGRIVATGTTFRATEHPDAHRYVRALIQGAGGIVGTQPFALYRPLSMGLKIRDRWSQDSVILPDCEVRIRLRLHNNTSRTVQPFVQVRWQEKPFFTTTTASLPGNGSVEWDLSLPARAFLESKTLYIEALLDKRFDPHHLVVQNFPLSEHDLKNPAYEPEW